MSADLAAIGFVGAGNFAHSLAELCARHPLIRISGCHDSNPTALAAFAQRFSCRAHHDFASLCADPAISGVIVATPNDLHHHHAVALARAGKHVFVEKPICLTLSDADRMIAACHDHHVVLAVGHQERRQRVYRTIKQKMSDGDFGVVHAFEANHCGNLLDHWPADDWRFDSTRGSGPLLHKGIHKIDILNYLFGSAQSVATVATPIPFNTEMHQTTVSVISYASGAIGSLTSGFRYNNASFNVYGEHQTVLYSGHGSRIRVKNEKTWEMTEHDCGTIDPIAEEIDEFALAMLGRGEIEVDGQVAREALLVALTAHEAERHHRMMSVDELRQGAAVG